MATAYENLVTARDNYAQQLAEISSPTARKPSYSISGPNGSKQVSWTEYQKFLSEQVTSLNALIAQAGGPVELYTQSL